MKLTEAKDLAMSQGATLFQDMDFGGYIAAYRPAKSIDQMDGRRQWARTILRPNSDGYTIGDWAFCAPPEGI